MSQSVQTNIHQQNPFVFVVGCPRSGTTLLQRMLNNHPQMAVAYDTLFIPAAVRKQKDKNPQITQELINKIIDFKRFSRFDFPPDILAHLAPKARDYAQLVSLIYEEFAHMHGKTLGGEKSPGYVRHMPLLQNLFPAAKFVHLVRDGRNVALSLLDWGKQKKRAKGPAKKYRLWAKSPVAVSALWWVYKAGHGRRDAPRIGSDAYTEVRYESLVAEPEAELTRLADFLDIPYSSDMVNFYAGKTNPTPGLSAKSAWLPATKGIRDWRVTMNHGDLELFEALAGECLLEFGYDLHFDTISQAVLDQADRYLELWQAETG